MLSTEEMEELLTCSVQWSHARDDIQRIQKAEALNIAPKGEGRRLAFEMLKITALVRGFLRRDDASAEQKQWARENVERDKEGYAFWVANLEAAMGETKQGDEAA